MNTLRHFIRTPIPSSGVKLSCRTAQASSIEALESLGAHRRTKEGSVYILSNNSLRYPKVS